MMKYIYQGDESTAIVSPVLIQESSFELARDKTPIVLTSVMLGTETILPKTYYSSLECDSLFDHYLFVPAHWILPFSIRQLNTCIRQDRTNQLLLHIPMNEVEKK
jgi:hypothetical protein